MGVERLQQRRAKVGPACWMVVLLFVVGACAPDESAVVDESEDQPEEIPDEEPEETPDEEPGETPDEEPEETPDEEPGETPDEEPPIDFSGETLDIVVGFSAGGGFDFYARGIAEYLPKYLPGEPNIVVQNVEGAGTAVAAAQVVDAEPDGTTIGAIQGANIVQRDLFGDPGVDYDTRQLGWLGVPHADIAVCVVRSDAAATTVEEMLDAEVTLSGSAAGTLGVDWPILLEEMIGLQVNVVEGYPGSTEQMLAVLTGEVDGTCTSWGSIEETLGEELEAGEVIVWNYATIRPMDHVSPHLTEELWGANFVPDEDARRIYDFYVGPRELHRSYVVTPGTPAEIIEVLQEAFVNVINDPNFREMMEGAGRPIELLDGPSAVEIVNAVHDTPPETVERVLEMLGIEY